MEFFASVTCDASGYGEGERFVGSQLVVQPGAGNLQLNELVPAGQYITATATDSQGNTSEFSACTVVDPPTVVTNTNLTGPGSLAAAITAANAMPNTQTITFNIPGASPATPAVISLGGVAMPIITESVADRRHVTAGL